MTFAWGWLLILGLFSTCYSRHRLFSKADCMLPSDHGHCRAAIQMFYFNPQTSSCQTFLYGGCGGNKNRFDDYYFQAYTVVSSKNKQFSPKFLKFSNRKSHHENLGNQPGSGVCNAPCRRYCSCGGRNIGPTINSEIERIRCRYPEILPPGQDTPLPICPLSKEAAVTQGSVSVKSGDDGSKREKRGFGRKLRRRLKKFGKQIENVGKKIRLYYSRQKGWNAEIQEMTNLEQVCPSI
ncbi:unnamed protein product [Allacma fusca]|uniref:BPTI/Kunitz inhibitor domain-containing protein n=1 Tax=Allacma fusca TaxID=39272 RepID=A0A8J2PBU1_9HEXA|nr:unnamed protein product [Allacma fusca]